MIAGILLTKKQVHKFLKEAGFSSTRKTFEGESGKYRFWKAPWGKHFPVPDDDFCCAWFVLEAMVESINSTKPKT